MIDIKISIGFSIINLTRKPWHELQDAANTLSNDYAFHTVPKVFSIDTFSLVTVGDSDLYVAVRRIEDHLEFLFIDFNGDWPCPSVPVELGEVEK